MNRVSVGDLRKRLAAVLDAVRDGEAYTVTRNGRDLAFIVSTAASPSGPDGPGGKPIPGVQQLADYRQMKEERDAARAEALRLGQVSSRLQAEVNDLTEALHNARELQSSTSTKCRRWAS